MAKTVEQDDWGVQPPDISHLITEDDVPVDNRYSDRQMRLLSAPLFDSWEEGKPFEALTDVGLFWKPDNDSVVAPDFLLSLGVEPREVTGDKEDRSYFVWLYGQPPNLVVEIVSNKEGGELSRKFEIYEKIGVAYYAVHDPFLHLGKRTLRLFRLVAGKYVECASAQWMPEIGLGLAMWKGVYQDVEADWLRFVDSEGRPIPTGAEAKADAESRATDAESRATDAESEIERLRKRLRELGED